MTPADSISAIGSSEKRVSMIFIRAILTSASTPKKSASKNIMTPEPKQS